MALGQLTHLPAEIDANPFHRLLVRFSRYKSGSFEALFQIESRLVRYSWLGLLVMLALVFPPLETVDGVSTVVRLSTLIYPCFFIWSLTRLSGIELMQLVLEGQWTPDLLATPMNDRDLTVGFATPLWLVLRQYFLITLFSLTLYTFETRTLVWDAQGEQWLGLEGFVRFMLFNYGLFYSAVAWVVFLYMARLLAEIRLRNGLLKGLTTLGLLLGGVTLFLADLLLLTIYSYQMESNIVLGGLAVIAVTLMGVAWMFYHHLNRHFRAHLLGQLDIDVLIIDTADPQASDWEKPATAAGSVSAI